MPLNICIVHVFNKHSLALIIYDNTSEETSKHSAVYSTKAVKPLLWETARWLRKRFIKLGNGGCNWLKILSPQLPEKELRRNRWTEVHQRCGITLSPKSPAAPCRSRPTASWGPTRGSNSLLWLGGAAEEHRRRKGAHRRKKRERSHGKRDRSTNRVLLHLCHRPYSPLAAAAPGTCFCCSECWLSSKKNQDLH